jgi:hypothetical protein
MTAQVARRETVNGVVPMRDAVVTDPISFGRYVGHSLKFIARADPNYSYWLMSQQWFRDGYRREYSAMRRHIAVRVAEEIESEDADAKRRANHAGPYRFMSAAEFCAADLV